MSKMSDKLNRYYNTTDGPVVVDSRGRTIGGREHAELEETPAVRHAVEHGLLLEQGGDEEDGNEDGSQASPSPVKKTASSNTNKEK
jgi:hypothetical protein